MMVRKQYMPKHKQKLLTKVGAWNAHRKYQKSNGRCWPSGFIRCENFAPCSSLFIVSSGCCILLHDMEGLQNGYGFHNLSSFCDSNAWCDFMLVERGEKKSKRKKEKTAATASTGQVISSFCVLLMLLPVSWGGYVILIGSNWIYW